MADIIKTDTVSNTTERMESDDGLPKLGEYYWVLSSHRPYWDHFKTLPTRDGYVEWLGCVMAIGSNYVALESPRFDSSTSQTRILFENCDQQLRFEPNPQAVIDEQIAIHRTKSQALIGRIQEVTKMLGVVPQKEIGEGDGEGTGALAVLSTQVDTAAYKNALVAAKDTTLPELFKEVGLANKTMGGWMTAPLLAMQASIQPMKATIRAVEDRIYTIELYAGVAEDAVKCADGDPAMMGEKLHIMQRRLYMDEECLLNYDTGGMEFRDIRDFDRWISQPENRDRLLPFPRTLAAFRVRRSDKQREDHGSFMQLWINIQLRDQDKYTYLYIRNGEQVWRIVCDYEFDEMIVPTRDSFDPAEPMMIKMFANSIDKMMPVREYEVRLAEYRERERLAEQWRLDNPDGNDFHNPHRRTWGFHPDEWKKLDQKNVYFDEANDKISEDIKRYNRIAIIIQGLFDRSLVLHPHPPVQMWSAYGFETAIKVVYDAETLSDGEKPDFEAYRARLNATLGPGSIVVGQEDAWMRREAIRENKKQEFDRSNRQRSNYTHLRPYGDPGPGVVAEVTDWKPRAKAATFKWEKEAASWRGAPRPCTITVLSTSLFNVSAYKPGDYKQFFADHRTRQEYLKWAPLLLAAEEYHAGTLKLGFPSTNRR